MKLLGRIFLNSRKEGRKDVKTEIRKDGVFLWVVEELTFLITFIIVIQTNLPIKRMVSFDWLIDSKHGG